MSRQSREGKLRLANIDLKSVLLNNQSRRKRVIITTPRRILFDNQSKLGIVQSTIDAPKRFLYGGEYIRMSPRQKTKMLDKNLIEGPLPKGLVFIPFK